MSNSHKKKRNTGLLYEFLVRTISKALIENDPKRSSAALKVVKRHFKPGSELHREFRLINSLVKTTVSSDAVAASIVGEAKLAARRHDTKSLDHEKSLLIREINHKLNDTGTFYDEHVNEYRIYATIQTLLNDWRSPEPDLERLGRYEDQLITWLTTEKSAPQEHVLTEESTGTNRLLIKVMMKKLNEKYAGTLTTEQKSIVKSYVWSASNNDYSAIKDKLTTVRTGLLESIDNFSSSNSLDEYVVGRLSDVRSRILAENLEAVDDDTVTRFMLYTKLNEELTSEDENDN